MINPRKTTKWSRDRHPPRKIIQNNDSEDDTGSQEKNEGKDWKDARNVYQRPRRTKEQTKEMNNPLEGINSRINDSEEWINDLKHTRLPYYWLPELAQSHLNQIDDAIQPSHPLSSSLSVFDLSQHQGLSQMSQFFASGDKSIGASASASVLPMNIQDWFPLGLTGWISLQSKELSRVFFITTVQKHQFFGTRLSLYSNSHINTWLLKNHSFD